MGYIIRRELGRIGDKSGGKVDDLLRKGIKGKRAYCDQGTKQAEVARQTDISDILELASML